MPDSGSLAAPGASIAEPSAKRAHNGQRLRTFAILLGMVAIPLIVIDQFTKLYVSSHMTLYQSIPVIPNWFDITYTQNPGAAFSMFATLPRVFRTGFLFALSTGAIIVLLLLIYQARSVTLATFSYALILAGAAGNLVDRAARGRVIDFLRLHYHVWSYPVFNIADSAITIGVLLIIGSAFLTRPEP